MRAEGTTRTRRTRTVLGLVVLLGKCLFVAGAVSAADDLPEGSGNHAGGLVSDLTSLGFAIDPPSSEAVKTPDDPAVRETETDLESSNGSESDQSKLSSAKKDAAAQAIPEPDPLRLANASPVDRMPLGLNIRRSDIDPASAPISYAKAALAESKDRFASVRDYTCTFIKRERIQGRLSGYEVMSMKARTSPQSVYFRFKQPKAGREAIYVHGRNGGKAIVHDVGFNKFLAGTLHLDPKSRRAMDGNRHPITEAGLGFMIETLTEGWNREMSVRDSDVTIRERVLVNKRPSTLIICKHRNRRPDFVFHEVRLYIDHELGLPTRFEAYDWPARDGQPAPLLEEYIYSDLKINVGLTDADFDPSNKAYSFGRF